jgi:ABC-type multidrug transport system fused ATPase/permease subunit
MNNKGSTMVLLVIAMAVIMALGVSILNIAMMQYNIRNYSTEAKQSLYRAEDGLNTAFSNIYTLIEEASSFALDEAEEYLNLYPLDESGAENVFCAGFKNYITANFKSRAESNFNPKVIITNQNLLFYENRLTVHLTSFYSTDKIEKNVKADIIVLVPSYLDVKNNVFDTADCIGFDNWINAN